MARVSISRHNSVRNINEKVDEEMFGCVGRGGWKVGGLVFIEIGSREDEDSEFG